MDNSTTTWIMVALLLLLIGAAVFMLLRRPGGDDAAVNHRDVRGVDAPGGSGHAGTDVVAEGRDLGPGTSAPEIDAPRERTDEPFDQHAVPGEQAAEEPVLGDRVADDRVTDGTAADERATDEHGVQDAGGADEDRGMRREAAALGAAGATGAGAVAATSDEEPARTAEVVETHETEYVLREDDHEPAAVAEDPFAAPVRGESVHDAPVQAESVYDAPAQDRYAEPVDDTYAAPMTDDTAYAEPVEDTTAAPLTDDTAYAEPVENLDEDRGRWRDAAAIGAAGAAGAGAAGVAATQDEPMQDEPAQVGTTWDETFTDRQAEGASAQVDEVGAAQGEVRPLSTDEIDDGARQEPLPVDEQTPPPAEEVSGADARARDDSQADEVRTDQTDAPGQEYEVGEPATTYRVDDGDAVAVAEPSQEEQAYHEDTTPVEDTTPAAEATPGVVAEDTASGGVAADSTGAVAEDTTGGATAASALDTADDAGSTGAADDAGSTGAEDDTGSTAAGGAVFAESAYGPGSAQPGEDGTGPTGWGIKGNTGSMLFHTPESPSYDAVRAEVWFESEETARAAGFAHWDRRRR